MKTYYIEWYYAEDDPTDSVEHLYTILAYDAMHAIISIREKLGFKPRSSYVEASTSPSQPADLYKEITR